MAIFFDEKSRVFALDTPNSSYRFGIFGPDGVLTHLYYGPRIKDSDLWSALIIDERDLPSVRPGRSGDFWDLVPQEYAGYGRGDMREPCLAVEAPDGSVSAELHYEAHRILAGKPAIPGLPATYGSGTDCETLEVDLTDDVLGLRVTLSYSVFEGIDCVCRSARIANIGNQSLKLCRALSAMTDMDRDGRDLDTLTLHGMWAAERMIDRSPLSMGRKLVKSRRGESSAQEQPFIAVLDRSATQMRGEVRGFLLV